RGEAATGVVLRGIDAVVGRAELERRVKQGSLADLYGGEPPIAPRPGVARPPGGLRGPTLPPPPPPRPGPAGGANPTSRAPRVVAVFEIGLYEYDAALSYTSLTTAQQFADLGGRVSGVEVRVADVYQARAIALSLGRKLGLPFWTRDWTEMNRNLFSAIQL